MSQVFLNWTPLNSLRQGLLFETRAYVSLLQRSSASIAAHPAFTCSPGTVHPHLHIASPLNSELHFGIYTWKCALVNSFCPRWSLTFIKTLVSINRTIRKLEKHRHFEINFLLTKCDWWETKGRETIARRRPSKSFQGSLYAGIL